MKAAAVLLSETELRSALEPLLDRLLVERLRYFQLQLEPRLQALIAAGLEPRATAGFGAGLARLLEAGDPNQTFAALFDETQALVGAARALLVIRGGEAAVWKSAGVSLAPRFPLAHQEAALRGPGGRRSGTHAISVRGTTVGLLYWEGAAEIEATARAQLEALLRVAGLLLFAQAFPQAPQAAPLAEPTATSMAPAPRAPAGTAAERFAQILIEDLELFLERERPEELAAARRRRDAATRFAPELERCRQALASRYPDERAPGALLQEATLRLGG